MKQERKKPACPEAPVERLVRTDLELNGTFKGYKPEYKEIDGSWKAIPTKQTVQGVPLPLMGRGVLDTIGLMGHAQASSIAWVFVAQMEAQGIGAEVRVSPYEVQFDIKARRLQDGHLLVS